MRIKPGFVLVSVALLAASQLALAQVEGPAKEMSELKAFEGNWTCKGTVPVSVLGPAHESSTTVKIQTDLSGMWYSGRVEEAASKDNPRPFKAVIHMNYDSTAKDFVILSMDNTGGYAIQKSPGWEGDKIVWTGQGTMMGKSVMARDTFTKQGAELKHLGEVQMDGKWITAQNEVCKKQAAAAKK